MHLFTEVDLDTLDNQFTLNCVTWQDGAPRLRVVREAAFKLGILVSAEVCSDDLDERCRHTLALSKDGQPVGCMRITPDGKIERVAILPVEYRSQIELGLLEAALIKMLSERSSEHRLAA